MEKEITIKMISHFQNEDEITRSLHARYRLAAQEAKLIYKQQLDPQQSKLTPEILTITLRPGGCVQRVEMKRPGTRFHLMFAAGETCKALYDTPAGTIETELHTQQLDGRCTEDEVKLHLQYELRLGGDLLGVTQLIITKE